MKIIKPMVFILSMLIFFFVFATYTDNTHSYVTRQTPVITLYEYNEDAPIVTRETETLQEDLRLYTIEEEDND